MPVRQAIDQALAAGALRVWVNRVLGIVSNILCAFANGHKDVAALR